MCISTIFPYFKEYVFRREILWQFYLAFVVQDELFYKKSISSHWGSLGLTAQGLPHATEKSVPSRNCNAKHICNFGGDLVTRSCLTLATPWTVALPGSSVHGIFQARILEQIASSFSRGSSWPRDQIRVSHITGGFFTTESPGKPSATWATVKRISGAQPFVDRGDRGMTNKNLLLCWLSLIICIETCCTLLWG